MVQLFSDISHDPASAFKQIDDGFLKPHLLLDPEGTVGRAYGAMTTPDMRVIDGEGRILFAGGIDDRPTNKVEDLEGANNFVRAALEDVEANRPIRTAYAQPYGCSIKYPGEA